MHDGTGRVQRLMPVCLVCQVGADGKEFKLESPFGDELPSKGFDPGEAAAACAQVEQTGVCSLSSQQSGLLVSGCRGRLPR